MRDLTPPRQQRASTHPRPAQPRPADETEEDASRAERLEALGQMARGLVHDFNNTLSPVLGYTELMLQDAQVVGNPRKFLEQIAVATLRAVQILRQLELFYRDADRAELVMVPVATLIRELVAEVFPTVFHSEGAAKTRHENRLELDETICAMADPDELRNLVVQLVTNAIEASGPEPSIILRWFRQGTNACLEVIDAGVGMSRELCRNCQEPFQTTKTTVGAGLGLSICQGIVRRLSGTLAIDSEIGRGTRVRVLLPRRDVRIK